MESLKQFTPEVIRQMGSYVYRLIDPRDGNTFYVGKGKGNRVFAHIKGTLKNYKGKNFFDKNADEDEVSAKMQTIREIHAAGLEVIHIIHRHGMNDATAFEVEGALIEAYNTLTNDADGHGNSDRGAMNPVQIDQAYAAKTIQSFGRDKCVIIKIRQSTVEIRGSVYEAVRARWVVGTVRLNALKSTKHYILAVVHGIVKGIYANAVWTSAADSHRYEFAAVEAPQPVQDRYLNRMIPSSFRKPGMAAPLLYTWDLDVGKEKNSGKAR
jgi:hypothetical protein